MANRCGPGEAQAKAKCRIRGKAKVEAKSRSLGKAKVEAKSRSRGKAKVAARKVREAISTPRCGLPEHWASRAAVLRQLMRTVLRKA